jgi:hypothetical protein
MFEPLLGLLTRGCVAGQSRNRRSPAPRSPDGSVTREVMGLNSNSFRCSMNRGRNFSTATLTSLQWASVFKLGV